MSWGWAQRVRRALVYVLSQALPRVLPRMLPVPPGRPWLLVRERLPVLLLPLLPMPAPLLEQEREIARRYQRKQ